MTIPFFSNLQNHATQKERLVNFVRGRECFVVLSILLVYGNNRQSKIWTRKGPKLRYSVLVSAPSCMGSNHRTQDHPKSPARGTEIWRQNILQSKCAFHWSEYFRPFFGPRNSVWSLIIMNRQKAVL